MEQPSSSTNGIPQPQNFLNGAVLGNNLAVIPAHSQTTQETLNSSFESAFLNGTYCDVNFTVGKNGKVEKIKAHKLVLAVRSPYFAALFGKKLPHRNEYKEPDVEPEIFRKILRFMYTDNIVLTLDSLTRVMSAAERFQMDTVEKKCIEFLTNELSLQNVCSLLIKVKQSKSEKLTDTCLKFIADHLKKILTSPDFLNMDNDTLCLVLKQDDLRIKETLLFEAVLRWSKTVCQKEGFQTNPDNLRAVLGNALFLIRFPLMTPEEFAKVVNTGILSDAEENSVFRYLVLKPKPSGCRFSSLRRRREAFLVDRYSSFNEGVYGDYSGELHKLVFSTNSDVSLVGVGLFGSPFMDKDYNVDITVKDWDCSTVLNQCSDIAACHSHKIFKTMLQQPIKMTANKKYLLEVKIKGKYFLRGNETTAFQEATFNQDGKHFRIEFFQRRRGSQIFPPKIETEGCLYPLETGQIPQLIFKL